MRPDGELEELPLPRDDPLQFVKRESYSEDTVDGVLDVLIEFLKTMVGC